ncbi:hypothetical protein HY68_35190 [Streptomyces sp. AcH 505]|uniref:sialidase family protein n=1 Tax=Streptomyces sp. AcH 505 TaxID=352211 RepID=UPI000591D47C|nr:hypothetical protein HY68_35190 [Streptomyces sp. AcH 505]
MALVTRARVWPALPIVLVLAVLTGLLLPRLATASTPDPDPAPNSARAAVSSASVFAPNFTDVSTVYSDTVSHGDGTRVPDIISTSETHAVVAWREGIVPNHVDQGYIRYSYTLDGGDTWSPPQMLVQETDKMTWNDVVLFQTGNQLFAYVTGDTAKSSQHHAGATTAVVVMRSTDEGHSWLPYPLTTDLAHLKENIVFSGRPLQLGPDSYVMPYWSTGRENGVLTSDDSDLKTWTPGGHPTNGATLPGENQIAVSQDDDGNGDVRDLVMVARANGNAAKATSSDGGRTWGPFKEDPALPSHNIAKDFFTTDSNGQYLYIYNSGTATVGQTGYRDKLAYKVQPKGGSWSAETPLVDTVLNDPPQPDGADWDTYPMADEYAPGKFYVVWEADTMHIMVGKLDVSGTAK